MPHPERLEPQQRFHTRPFALGDHSRRQTPASLDRVRTIGWLLSQYRRYAKKATSEQTNSSRISASRFDEFAHPPWSCVPWDCPCRRYYPVAISEPAVAR